MKVQILVRAIVIDSSSDNCYYCLRGGQEDEDFQYENFILPKNSLYHLTNLTTLKLGRVRDSANLSDLDFSHFPFLMKLSYCEFSFEEKEHEREFECSEEEKALGKGKIQWSRYYLDDYSDEKVIQRYEYKGEVDKKYKMSGRGVLWYHENYEDAKKFVGKFEDDEEREGVLKTYDRDRFEVKIDLQFMKKQRFFSRMVIDTRVN